MSNTRRAQEGGRPRQERYMSSFDRGLMANIVARRCEALDNPKARELVWFLQLLSWEDGGLDAVADELAQIAGDRIGTRRMLEAGLKPGMMCNARLARAIRRECIGDRDSDFESGASQLEWEERALTNGRLSQASQRIQAFAETGVMPPPLPPPADVPADGFFESCRHAMAKLPEWLEEACINPAITWEAGPWYFHALPKVLAEYEQAWIARRVDGVVTTEIGHKVNLALDYCHESGRLVLIDGDARTGKSYATRKWCARRPGHARKVDVPSTNDDMAFFHAIARALGISININSKGWMLRNRIEDTLQRSRLTVVFDEAHYLWPQGNNREAMPGRVNWIMTALVNQGVPVGLVATPQFMALQKRVEEKTAWTSAQFIGRIGRYERLPSMLAGADLEAVARWRLPHGDATSIQLLVDYARASARYLAGIDSAVSAAEFTASRAGRSQPTRADIKAAILQSAIPSDNAFAAAAAKVKKPRRGRPVGVVQDDCEPAAPAVPPARRTTAAEAREEDFTAPDRTQSVQVMTHHG